MIDSKYFEFIIVLHNVILELSKLAELCARLLKQSSKSLDTVYSSIVICKCHYHLEWFYICLVQEFQLDLAYGCGTHAFWLSGCDMVLEGMGNILQTHCYKKGDSFGNWGMKESPTSITKDNIFHKIVLHLCF